jgi:methionine-rich copper-binding protein CopC
MSCRGHFTRFAGGLIAFFVATLYTVLFASPAFAAPRYEDSEPNAGAAVQTAPSSVSVSFSEPLDDSSSLSVANACGDRVDSGATTVDLNEMQIAIPEAHYSGKYTVSYHAVGLEGVTGETDGSFTFEVAEGHPCDDHGDKKHPEHPKHPDHPEDPDHPKHPEEHDPKEGHGVRHDGDGGHGDGHAEGDHSMTDHGASSHTGHSSTSASHGSHESGSARPGSHHENGKHGTDGDHGRHDPTEGSFTSGPLPRLPADGQAALLALVLCAGLGVVGGVFLRSAG